MKPVVIFRQGGNNLRLGNTLVWVAAAHDWCDRHGFEFCFPAASRILGGLLAPQSPLMSWPPALAAAWLGGGLPIADDRVAAIDAVLARVLTLAREVAPKMEGVEPMLSIVPGALGCVVHGRGCDWESPAMLEFVRAHSTCIVNEPHPFMLPAPVPPSALVAALAPSAEARAIVAAVAADVAAGGAAIGVHVRQTDYRRWQDGKFFRDNAFYNEFIARALPLLAPGSRLFVAHDGEFVADPALLAQAQIAVSQGTEAEAMRDFVRFAACDFLVGPQSTFTVQAMKIGQLWAPRQRDLIHLRPETTVGDLLASLQSRLSARTVPCP